MNMVSKMHGKNRVPLWQRTLRSFEQAMNAPTGNERADVARK